MNKILIFFVIAGISVLCSCAYAENCTNDTDGDGICDDADNCITINNTDQNDTDNDGIGDACDNCIVISNPNQLDKDNDFFGNTCDNCPGLYNPGQNDTDNDGVGDLCDNCPYTKNPGQENSDDDSEGNACDPDTDSDYDGIPDDEDNCVNIANPGQDDSDNDGTGDACETSNNETSNNESSNLNVTEAKITKLKIRISNIKPGTSEEKNLKDIAEKFINDYTSKEAYELIINIVDLLNACIYFNNEWEIKNRENINLAAENIDKIYLKILELEVPVYGGNEYTEMFEDVKKQSNKTYSEKILFMAAEVKNLKSDISNAEKDKIRAGNSKTALLGKKETLAEDIGILKEELNEKNKQKQGKIDLLNIEKDEYKKVSDEYNDLKNSVAGECSGNIYLGLFLGLIAGVMVTYILKKESDYWSTYTSADVSNPAIKALLIITSILIIIFVLLMFTDAPVTYCYF